MMQFLGPLLAQLAGSAMAQGGGQQQQGGGGLGMAQQPMMQSNPLGRSILGGLGAGLKAPVTGAMPAPMAEVPGAAAAPPQGTGQVPPAPQQAPQGGGMPDQGPLFRGSAPAGNGGLSGAIPGLGAPGAMPTPASNFGMVFPGMGMAPPAAMSQGGGQGGGGLQFLLQLLRGGMGAGL